MVGIPNPWTSLSAITQFVITNNSGNTAVVQVRVLHDSEPPFKIFDYTTFVPTDSIQFNDHKRMHPQSNFVSAYFLWGDQTTEMRADYFAGINGENILDIEPGPIDPIRDAGAWAAWQQSCIDAVALSKDRQPNVPDRKST